MPADAARNVCLSILMQTKNFILLYLSALQHWIHHHAYIKHGIELAVVRVAACMPAAFTVFWNAMAFGSATDLSAKQMLPFIHGDAEQGRRPVLPPASLAHMT